jgi:hypothetical protein
MYQTNVTFTYNNKTESMVIATESHPEDIANETWQSLVYDRLMNTEGLSYKDITINDYSILCE